MTTAVEIKVARGEEKGVSVSFRDSRGANNEEATGNLAMIAPGKSETVYVQEGRKLVIEEATISEE